MAAMFHCLARAKRLFLLAVLFLFCLALPARAIRCDATAFGNGFEKQLKEEQPVSGQEAYTGDFALGEEGRIGLFVRNNPVNYIDPYGLWSFSQWWYNLWHMGPSDKSPYSNQSLLAEEDNGIMNNFNGKTGAQVATDILTAGPKALAQVLPMAIVPEEGLYDSATEALEALRAAKVARNSSKCFNSFTALKRALPNSPGKVWHHIVEQSQEGRFGTAVIQNADNVLEVSPEVNNSLNALYSSIRPEITGSDSLTVRQWLSTQSLYQAQSFGYRAMINVSNGIWP
jgi:hypothetical protein